MFYFEHPIIKLMERYMPFVYTILQYILRYIILQYVEFQRTLSE